MVRARSMRSTRPASPSSCRRRSPMPPSGRWRGCRRSRWWSAARGRGGAGVGGGAGRSAGRGAALGARAHRRALLRRSRHPVRSSATVDPVPDPWSLWRLGGDGVSAPPGRGLATGHSASASRRPARGGDGVVSRTGAGRRCRRRGRRAPRRRAPAAGSLQRSPAPWRSPSPASAAPPIDLVNLHPESLAAVIPDPPLAHAAWELLRDGADPDAGAARVGGVAPGLALQRTGCD